MKKRDHHIATHRPGTGAGLSGATMLGISVIVCLFWFVLDLSFGSVRIPFGEVIKMLTGQAVDNELWEKIIFMIRMPRAVSAVLAGGALAVAGLQMQTLFHNPLAGPSVLGITAGASLGVAVVMLGAGSAASVYAISKTGIGGSWLIVCAAAVGAGAVMFFIMLLSMRLRDNVSLLIIGLMVGYITVSIVSIWQYFSNPEQIQDYLLWTFGTLGGVTTGQLNIYGAVAVAGMVMAYLGSKQLNALLLGENYARSLGVNIRVTRIYIITVTSLLAGVVIAFNGPIAFVGIAVPHLARMVMGTSDHRILIPASLLFGAMLMLGCDIIARMPGSQMTLPINAVTALIGAPVVVWVILRSRNLRTAF